MNSRETQGSEPASRTSCTNRLIYWGGVAAAAVHVTSAQLRHSHVHAHMQKKNASSRNVTQRREDEPTQTGTKTLSSHTWVKKRLKNKDVNPNRHSDVKFH